MNQVNQFAKCQCCRSDFDVDEGVVDINKRGEYVYYCSEFCFDQVNNKGHKNNDRAARNERRKQKYEYSEGE